MNRNIAQYAFCSRTIARRGSVSCKKGGSVSQTELQCSDDLMMNVVFFLYVFLSFIEIIDICDVYDYGKDIKQIYNDSFSEQAKTIRT